MYLMALSSGSVMCAGIGGMRLDGGMMATKLLVLKYLYISWSQGYFNEVDGVLETVEINKSQ